MLVHFFRRYMLYKAKNGITEIEIYIVYERLYVYMDYCTSHRWTERKWGNRRRRQSLIFPSKEGNYKISDMTSAMLVFLIPGASSIYLYIHTHEIFLLAEKQCFIAHVCINFNESPEKTCNAFCRILSAYNIRTFFRALFLTATFTTRASFFSNPIDAYNA